MTHVRLPNDPTACTHRFSRFTRHGGAARLARTSLPAICALALLGLTAAPAFATSASAAATARYQQERAQCNQKPADQDRAACLKDAGAALAEARKGKTQADVDFAANQTRRCDRLPDGDRQACIARMQGQGTTSGSVAGGGILRELVIVEKVPPTAPKTTP